LTSIAVEVDDDAAAVWCKDQFDPWRLCACGHRIGALPVVARAVAPGPRYFHQTCARAHALDLLEDAAGLELLESPARAVPLLRAALMAMEQRV
jgi:hypothetical protein